MLPLAHGNLKYDFCTHKKFFFVRVSPPGGCHTVRSVHPSPNLYICEQIERNSKIHCWGSIGICSHVQYDIYGEQSPSLLTVIIAAPCTNHRRHWTHLFRLAMHQ